MTKFYVISKENYESLQNDVNGRINYDLTNQFIVSNGDYKEVKSKISGKDITVFDRLKAGKIAFYSGLGRIYSVKNSCIEDSTIIDGEKFGSTVKYNKLSKKNTAILKSVYDYLMKNYPLDRKLCFQTEFLGNVVGNLDIKNLKIILYCTMKKVKFQLNLRKKDIY
jgi:hypothetical protein